MTTRRLLLIIAGAVALVVLVLVISKSRPLDEKSTHVDRLPRSDGPVREKSYEQRSETTNEQTLERPSDGKSVQFKGTNLELPILAEDDGVDSPSAELMKEISADLSLIYGDLTKFEIVPRNSERLIVINGRAQKIENRLSFSGGDLRRPESHDDQFGLITKFQGVNTLIIPQPLLREYKEALAFRNANNVVVESARNFIDSFNKNSKDPLGSNRKPDMFWAPGNPNSHGLDENAVIFQSSSETLRRPSLLSFRKPSKEEFEMFPQLPRESFLADAILRTGDGKYTDYLPLVWINGGWRIMLVTPGT